MKKTALSAVSCARSAFVKNASLTVVAAFIATPQLSFAGAKSVPNWLRLQPGAFARVDIAPWRTFDEPEAALTQSAASMQRDYTAIGSRPSDIVYRPVGVRVRVVRVLADRAIVLVHGVGERWEAYTQTNRLLPEIPNGTHLVAAGGFEGFADFFPSLDTPQRSAQRVSTDTGLRALGMDGAPYDPDSTDLVRVHVLVTSGALMGRNGWIAAGFTGVPTTPSRAFRSQIEKTCSCLPVSFE